MASYFEKLTSSSLSLHKQAKDSNQKSSKATPSELSSAIEKIEELRELNSKLELDLKCEHDEKADLVGLKVGLENEVLNLREVNERLEFQVEQLRVEKDKIHHVLAKFREGGGGSGSGAENRGGGLFIATSGGGGLGGGGSGGFGLMKKFPSLDDLALNSPPAATSPLFTSPSTSPPPGLVRVVTPTSMASGGPLERITEEDETLLESLVMSNNSNGKNEPSTSSSSSSKQLQLPQQQHPRMEDLLKKIAFLESENIRLTRKKFVCSKCKRKSHNGRRNPAGGMIFEDEGLVLSAVDDEDDEEEEEDDADEDEAYNEPDDDGFNDDDAGAVAGSSRSSSSLASSAKQSSTSSDISTGTVIKTQANSILEIQQKIIEKLERELSVIVDGLEEGEEGEDHDGYAEGRRDRRKSKEAELAMEVSNMKEELEKRMNGIVWIAANTKKGEGEGDDKHPSQ